MGPPKIFNPQLPTAVTFSLLGVERCSDMRWKGNTFNFAFLAFPDVWGWFARPKQVVTSFFPLMKQGGYPPN